MFPVIPPCSLTAEFDQKFERVTLVAANVAASLRHR